MDCLHRFNQEIQSSVQTNNTQVLSSNTDISDQFSTILSMPNSLWYPDSGASHHVTNDSTNYTSKSNYNGAEQVKLGNGTGLSITHIGSASLSSLSNSSSFVLNKVFLFKIIEYGVS